MHFDLWQKKNYFLNLLHTYKEWQGVETVYYDDHFGLPHFLEEYRKKKNKLWIEFLLWIYFSFFMDSVARTCVWIGFGYTLHTIAHPGYFYTSVMLGFFFMCMGYCLFYDIHKYIKLWGSNWKREHNENLFWQQLISNFDIFLLENIYCESF